MAYKKGDVFPPQFEDVNGNPLVLGTIEFYQWNTTTPQPIAFDADGNTTATSVTLDLYGRPSNGGDPVDLFYNDALTYKIIRKDAAGTEISPVLGPYSPPIAGSDFLTDDDPDLGAGLLPYDQSLDYAEGSVGARLLRQLSAKDEPFNCVGDGVTNDTVAMQAFLTACAGKIGLIPPGIYLCNALTIYSNTKLSMHGATIKAISSLSASVPLLINGALDGTETGIEIYGGTYQGNSGARTSELVSMIRVDHLKIHGTRFTANQYIGLALGGCTHFDLDIEVDNWGKTAVTAEGGAGLWLGTYSSLYPCQHGSVKVLAHNGEWSGVYVTGVAGHLCSDIKLYPEIYSVKEGGIFGAYFDGLQIIAPEINTVVKKNISGSGIELGGINFSIEGGYITTCDASAIALTDCQLGQVGAGLVTRNCRRDAASFPTGSHISIITTQVFPNQPRWLTIEGHKAVDTSSPAYGAIEIGNSGDAIQNVTIQNNSYSGTTFAGGDPIQIAAGKWGAGCFRSNNAGSWDAKGGISGDRGDASITLVVGVDEETQLFETALTANRAVSLDSTSAYEGARFRISRSGLGAFTLTVGGGLKVMPAATAAWCDVIYTGAIWKLSGYGTL